MRSFDVSQPAVPYLSGPYADALLNDFRGEIKEIVRVMPSNNLFTVNNKPYNEKKVYYADSNFFTLFSFPLLKGNPATALKDASSVVLTESTARRYFGDKRSHG